MGDNDNGIVDMVSCGVVDLVSISAIVVIEVVVGVRGVGFFAVLIDWSGNITL